MIRRVCVFRPSRIARTISPLKIIPRSIIFVISLPGGRTLPPPLGHIFRFHIIEGDAVLIVQFITQVPFSRQEHLFNFLEAFSRTFHSRFWKCFDSCINFVFAFTKWYRRVALFFSSVCNAAPSTDLEALMSFPTVVASSRVSAESIRLRYSSAKVSIFTEDCCAFCVVDKLSSVISVKLMCCTGAGFTSRSSRRSSSSSGV